MFDNSVFVPMFDHCTACYVSNHLSKTGEINIVIIQTEKNLLETLTATEKNAPRAEDDRTYANQQRRFAKQENT